MNRAPSWQSVVVAVAVIALVGVFFVVGLRETDDTDDFLKVWAGLGTVVGVVAGAIPAFFFKTQAEKAVEQAQGADARFRALAATATPDQMHDARTMAPAAFSE